MAGTGVDGRLSGRPFQSGGRHQDAEGDPARVEQYRRLLDGDGSGAHQDPAADGPGPHRPFDRAGLFDRPGGLKPVEPAYQRAVEAAVPRDAQGAPVVHPPVERGWVDAINGGGPQADLFRANNSADSTRAGLDTWFGDPQAAAARLPEHSDDGVPDLRGETDAVGNTERWAGAEYVPEGAGPGAYDAIAAKLRDAGPGSAATVLVEWPAEPGAGGPAGPDTHQFAAVNDAGRITWIDFQNRIISRIPPYPEVGRVWSITLDPDRNPVREPTAAPEHTSIHEPGPAHEHTPVRDSPARDTAPVSREDRPADQAARRALDLAAATRTRDGQVDPGALQDLFRALPRLDVEGAGGVDSALSRFAAESLGLEHAEVRRLEGGDGEGISGAPVFLVRDADGVTVAIAKIFPKTAEIAQELSGFDRLGAAEFTRFAVPRAHGVAAVDRDGTDAGVLVMSLAPGRSLFDMLNEVPQAGSPARPAAMVELHAAVGQVGAAFAELHSVPAGSGGPVEPRILNYLGPLVRARIQDLTAVPGFARTGLEPGELQPRYEAVLAAARADSGGSSLMHGDAHPGNVFWSAQAGVTFIDLPNAHFSIGAGGEPIGSPARDVAFMMHGLAVFGRLADLPASDVASLQDAFTEAYRQAGGPAVSDEVRTAFAAWCAIRDALVASDKMVRAEAEEVPALEEQWDFQIGLLRSALRWTP